MKLKRKDIPAEVKEFLKDPKALSEPEQRFFKSLATQLKTKHFLSDKQVQIVKDFLNK